MIFALKRAILVFLPQQTKESMGRLSGGVKFPVKPSWGLEAFKVRAYLFFKSMGAQEHNEGFLARMDQARHVQSNPC